MSLYRKLYDKLVARIEEAAALLEQGEAEEAKRLLLKTSREAEEFRLEVIPETEEK